MVYSAYSDFKERNILFIPIICLALCVSFALKAQVTPVVTINTVSCKSGCHGFAFATVDGVSNPPGYKYTWTDGTHRYFDSALCTGTYTVIVQDTAGGGGADTVSFTLKSGVNIKPVTSPYSCAHLCDGNAAIYLPGISGVKYSWYVRGSSPHKNTSVDSQRVCPGRDTVLVNIPGCPEETIYFYVPPPPLLIATVLYITPTSCSGACNGRAALAASGGEGNWKVTWSDGTKGFTDTALCYGKTYTATVTDGGCYNTSVKISLPPPVAHKILAHVYVDSSACVCSSTATVTKVDYAGAPLTYKWSRSGETTKTITGLCPGKYTVIASGICGSDTETINIHTVRVHVGVTSTPSCHCNGTARAVLSNGGNKVTYKWSNGDTGRFIQGLCVGTYTVYASSPCGKDTATVVIKPPTPMHFSDTSIVNKVCPGSCKVSERVLDTGGLKPYHYLWSNGDTSAVGKKLCDGHTYYVKVWDNCGDSTRDTVTVHVHPSRPTGKALVTQYCCRGTCNGSASAVVGSGGVPPFTIKWSNGDTTAITTGLCPDSTYKITITDTCGKRDSFNFTFPGPPSMSATFTNTNYTCPGSHNGTGYISVSGGIGPYKYSWSNGLKTSVGTGLTTDTTYRVTITDSCGDSIVYRFKFPYPPGMSINMGFSATCSGHCVGTAYAYVSGGLLPYTFTWSSGDTGSAVYKACHGKLYTVKVKDLCGTTLTDTVSIPLAAPLTCSVSLTGKPCPGKCNGIATVTTSGGIPPFYYTWSSGSTATTATNLCGDSTYRVLINDPGCITDTLTIKIPKTQALKDSIVTLSPSCPAACNGYAKVQAHGGIAPYTYNWSNGYKGNIVTLCAGKYNVVVSDNCSDHDTIKIVIPLVKIAAKIVSLTNDRCYGDSAGLVTLSVSGGKTPYKYKWSNGSTDSVGNSLGAGYYSVVVYDSGCAYDTLHFTITSPPKLIDSVHVVSSALCNGVCNGRATVYGYGGKAPLKFTWSNGDTVRVVTALCPGNEFVVVSDSGCVSDTLRYTIPALTILHIAPLTVHAALCHDTCNGSAFAPAASGGYPPYTYFWSNGSIGTEVHNLCGGINILTVKDSLGCFVKDTANVPQPGILNITLDSVAAHCTNPDGRVSITLASGGTQPFKFKWDNGKTGTADSALTKGLHTISVTDSNHCPYSFTFILPGVWPKVTAKPDTAIYYGNTLELTADGALRYKWWPNIYLNCDTCAKPVFSGLVFTHYCVEGTDSFGCKDTACIDIRIRHDCGIPFLPDAFTPNADHINDHFHVLGNCLSSAHLIVYNRWGQKVFESFDLHLGWDGTYQSQPCAQGVFIYVCDATNLFGESYHFRGDVTLVR